MRPHTNLLKEKTPHSNFSITKKEMEKKNPLGSHANVAVFKDKRGLML